MCNFGTTLVWVYHEIFEWSSMFSNHFITSIHLLIVDCVNWIHRSKLQQKLYKNKMIFNYAFQNVCTMSICSGLSGFETHCIDLGYYIINGNYLLIWSQIPHVLDIQPDVFPRTNSTNHGFISICCLLVLTIMTFLYWDRWWQEGTNEFTSHLMSPTFAYQNFGLPELILNRQQERKWE